MCLNWIAWDISTPDILAWGLFISGYFMVISPFCACPGMPGEQILLGQSLGWKKHTWHSLTGGVTVSLGAHDSLIVDLKVWDESSELYWKCKLHVNYDHYQLSSLLGWYNFSSSTGEKTNSLVHSTAMTAKFVNWLLGILYYNLVTWQSLYYWS
jgi:hypothetical protein